MCKTVKIAIDGPSGAGKSTIAKLLARALGYVYLDTGAMYRAIALKADAAGCLPQESNRLAHVLENTEIRIDYRDDAMHISVDGVDVSEKIREHRVSKLASDFSALKSVRLKLVDMQRRLSSAANTVLDGRDIGTFVLPDADYKFYLTASAEERAKRRSLELERRGQPCAYEQVLADIRQRDRQDTEREFAPLRKAPDAKEIDSTNLTIEQVVAEMLQAIGE